MNKLQKAKAKPSEDVQLLEGGGTAAPITGKPILVRKDNVSIRSVQESFGDAGIDTKNSSISDLRKDVQQLRGTLSIMFMKLKDFETFVDDITRFLNVNHDRFNGVNSILVPRIEKLEHDSRVLELSLKLQTDRLDDALKEE